MTDVTIVYQPKPQLCISHDKRAKHIENASSEKIQTFINNGGIFAIDYILVHIHSLALVSFKVYATQDELVHFMEEWDLQY